MKTLSTLLLSLLAVAALQAAPKKLLVVTTTTGFRHSSIPTGEKMLAQLAKDSGTFTVDFLQQPDGKPGAPKKPTALKADASDADKAASKSTEEKFAADSATFAVAEAKWEASLKQALLKLTPDSLKHYDGVIFFSTTGDLPIPDKDGFLAWIKAGHAFIGIHAASDTFPHWPEYIEMLGGEFAHHGAQVGVECLIQDPQHPATKHLGKSLTIQQEEIYQFKNYDAAKVHDLLIMDKHPEHQEESGHFAVSWCKDYGTGKVFYTSLGHREDIIDADPNLKDRKNSVEISQAYQTHVLGGIQWALGLRK